MHAKHQHISKSYDRDLGVEHFHVGLAGLKPGAEDRLLLLSVWCTVRDHHYFESIWAGLGCSPNVQARARSQHTHAHRHMQLAIK